VSKTEITVPVASVLLDVKLSSTGKYFVFMFLQNTSRGMPQVQRKFAIY
jgi:hypothetical protein